MGTASVAPTTPAATTTLPPSHMKDIASGVLKGLLSDTDDFNTCYMDGFSVSAMLGAALFDFKAGKIVDACTDMSIALGKIEPMAGGCGTVKDEVVKLVGELKDIDEEKAMNNFKTKHSAIMEDVSQASAARDAGKYEEYGMLLGFALRKIIAEDSVIV